MPSDELKNSKINLWPDAVNAFCDGIHDKHFRKI